MMDRLSHEVFRGYIVSSEGQPGPPVTTARA